MNNPKFRQEIDHLLVEYHSGNIFSLAFIDETGEKRLCIPVKKKQIRQLMQALSDVKVVMNLNPEDKQELLKFKADK